MISPILPGSTPRSLLDAADARVHSAFDLLAIAGGWVAWAVVVGAALFAVALIASLVVSEEDAREAEPRPAASEREPSPTARPHLQTR